MNLYLAYAICKYIKSGKLNGYAKVSSTPPTNLILAIRKTLSMALPLDRVHLFALFLDFSSLQGNGLGYNMEHSRNFDGVLWTVVPQEIRVENGALEASIELRTK